MVQNFEIGDQVRIDGEDGVHIIKEIKSYKRPIGWHVIVVMQDGKIGLVNSSGYTDMTKVE